MTRLNARVTQVLRPGVQVTASGAPLPTPDRIEITPDRGRSGGFLLVRYTDSGEFCGDSWHEDLDLALEQAEAEYGLQPQDFVMVKE